MKKITLLLIAALLAFSVVACATTDDEKETTNVGEVDKTPEYDFYKSEEAVYEINSKHCQLFFPTKWQDDVKTVVYEDETMYKVSFYAELESNSIPLYDFVFGSSEEGYLLGTVKTDAGEQSVYLVDTSSAYEGQLSEDYERIYYEMCEGVNDIISNLVYANGMTLASVE